MSSKGQGMVVVAMMYNNPYGEDIFYRWIAPFWQNHYLQGTDEGMTVTPERVKELTLNTLEIRAAFVGFKDQSYLDDILKHSKENGDWVYKKIMEEERGDDSSVRQWFNNAIVRNGEIEKLSKEYGYGFFVPDKDNFGGYCDAVVDYLLK
ncbi:MAG: hypothetical protein KGI49_00340 [Patescibacteria group bacterium]|nr:hypothetical protein [Patescibacteria group bacterium]